MAKKKGDCFNAGIHVTHLIGNLFQAAVAADGNKRVSARSLLADAALDARDLSKTGFGKVKKLARSISLQAAKLSRKADVGAKEIYALRQKARQVKTAAASACRSSTF